MKARYFLATLFLAAAASAEESCFYPSKKEGGSLDQFTDCGTIEGEHFKLGKSHAKNIAYDQKGLACILTPKGAFYLHRSGKSQRTVVFDNGCDYFEKGLARGLVANKMVAINTKLEIVLSPGFDLLSYYAHGHFKACNGPFTEEKHGEHTLLKGGQCGLLNQQGALVVPADYRIEDSLAFDLYLNTHNHCPRPPITTKSAALCHAKRHIAEIDGRSAQWSSHQISRVNTTWLITFTEKHSKEESTLSLNADSASWISLSAQSHQEALQKSSY